MPDTNDKLPNDPGSYEDQGTTRTDVPQHGAIGEEYLLSQQTGQPAPMPEELHSDDMTSKERSRAESSRKNVTQSYWSLVRHQFRKNKVSMFALYVVYFLFGIAIFADVIANDKPLYAVYNGETYFPVFKDYSNALGFAKWSPDLINADWKQFESQGKLTSVVWPPIRYRGPSQDLEHNYASPGSGHLLGTDAIGRDVLAGMIHGSRIALTIGFLSMSIAILLGIVLGALAGYYGGWIDVLISRLIELVITLPTFFLIITVVAMFQSGSIWLVMILIGFTGWPGIARFTRGEFLRIRNMEFVAAATALGFTNTRVIFRHVLPNSLAPVLVTAAFGIASAILIEATLSFLGFGVPPTIVTWGSVLNEARDNLSAWWLAVFPGFAIFVAVVAYNLVGDGLRDALDPRLRD
jgi:peptide/nickel transport system permease protein